MTGHFRSALVSGAAIIGLAAPAAAQDQAAGEIASPAQDAAAQAPGDQGGDDILVTARRTTERLQDVPVAITALSGEALAARGIDTLDQVAKYTPNIRFDGAAALSGGNYNATVFVRGVGQNDFAIFSDPGVGFYVDDVYYARSIGGIMDAVDIANVQVLRGPQGTLFGRNTIGGAVLITTAAPEIGEWSGRIEATTGSFDRVDVKGAVNIPLGEVAALRISGATLNRDGYVTRLLDGGTLGNRNSDMIRAKLRLKPSDSLTIDIGGDYTRARENSAPSKLLVVGNVPGITGIPFLTNYNRFVAPSRGIVAPNGLPTLNPSFITDDPFTTWAGGPNRNDLDLWGVQGTIAWDFAEGVTLKSISAYRDMHAVFNRDGDNTPFVFRETGNDDRQWQFSQEVQLSGSVLDDRLTFVVGGFYFKEKAQDLARADLAVGLNPPLPPPYSPAAFPNNFTNNESYAVFAQASFELFPDFSIELGGRYSSDRKTFRTFVVRQRDNVTFIDVTRSDTFDDFTPRVGVNWKLSPTVLVYASYSQGFKQGGFNGRPLVTNDEVTRYEPETLDSYEVGIKAETANRELTANVAVFRGDYNDIQLTVNQTPFNFVANAARGRVEGVEAEFVARPADWFTANASLGLLRARYTEVGQGLGPTQILPITTNSRFVKAPEVTATAGFEASREIADGKAALRGDVSYYSRTFHDVANTRIITDDGYALVNARLSYTLPGEAVTVSVFGTNLTDTLYLVSGNASPAFGLAEASYGRPREWGASVGYRF